MNNLIVHKIIKYVRKAEIAKIFFYFLDYRILINSSNFHFDELYDLYGNKDWEKIPNNIRSVESMFRLKIPFIYSRRGPMDYAAQNGHLKIIKWLHKSGGMCTTDAMDSAATYGHLEVVKWLHENRTEGCTTYAMDYAVINGHLEVVKWLHENRAANCSTWAKEWAIKKGYLEVVKWIESHCLCKR